MRNQRLSTTLQYQLMQKAEWQTNWAVLVCFTTLAEDELIVLAQTIMTILFGSYPSSSYLSCRPKHLKPCPPGWGLNEKAPLCLDGLPRYRENLNDRNRREQICQPTTAMSSKGIAFKASCRRQELLSNGGPIRVYVLQQAGRVTRFFITLLTARDGAHVDIVIPLLVGLKYGLQESRTVHINVEVGAGNHFAPFATKAAHNGNARKLGIIISGTYAIGPRKGTKFTHWLQSPTQAAIGKAEKLTSYLSKCFDYSLAEVGETKSRKFVTWSDRKFLHVSERQKEHSRSVTRKSPGDQSVEEHAVLQQCDDRMYHVVLPIIQALQQLAISYKIRTTRNILSYFKTCTAQSIADTISGAVRPIVADLLLSTEEFTVSR
jgi:hypothetical protein